MLAGLRYLDSRFKDHLESETGAERPAELCRLFAMVSIIREELLYPAMSISTARSWTI